VFYQTPPASGVSLFVHLVADAAKLARNDIQVIHASCNPHGDDNQYHEQASDFPLIHADILRWKMMSKQFHSARLKLKRAKEHIDDLHFRVRQFCESGIHRITVEQDEKVGYETLKITPTKTVPDDFALIFGDSLHNLASALDLAWFELTAADSTDKRKINFPIYPAREHLEKFIKSRPKQASIVAVRGKLLDEIQPYKGGDGDAIYTIHHINIADKHRLMIPQVQIGRIEAIRCEDGDGVRFEIGPRHFGTRNSPLIGLGNHRNVKVIDEGQSTLAVVFGVCEEVQSVTSLPIIPVLLKFQRTVRRALETLAR
jgi:hypothetical protein